jgi:hypothetical protein
VLVVVVAAAAALIAYKVVAAIAAGPDWDTYAFLANAAEFAGRGYGYTELHRPPLLSVVTAGAFSLGAPLEIAVIQWIDGAFTLAGIIAFYLIARRRFRPLLAGVGALMLLSIQPLWAYLGSGYTDFPSVALSLWMLWACIKATEDDPRWYLLAGPLFVMATMTRYTALLAAFPTAVWLLLRWRPFHQARYIGGGLLLAVVAYLPAARFYASRFGDALFPFMVAFGMSEEVSAQGGEVSVASSALWYVRQLPAFIAGEGLAIVGLALLFVVALGTVLGLVGHFQSHKPRPSRLAVGLLACAPALLAQLGGGLVLRQITIPIAVIGLWRSFAPYEEDDAGRRPAAEAALFAAMAAWLFTYADFHGHQQLQVPRYITTIAAPLVFFAMHGVETFVHDIRRTLGQREVAIPRSEAPRAVGLIAALVLAVFLATVLAATVPTTPDTPREMVVMARDSAAWLERQSDIDDAVVFSDLWPLSAWYLQMNVQPMPIFAEPAAYQHALDRSGADYYVTTSSRSFDGMITAERLPEGQVLERTDAAPTRTPRVLYLGKAWDNYLESLTRYTFYLDGDPGRFGWEGTAFIDGVSLDELSGYDVVALYGMRWRDRARGEAMLEEYVRRGGALVIDASANLGRPPYSLADTVMFNTTIRRGSLPADAEIELLPPFARRHPGLGEIDAAPFVDETGSAWYGAEYATLPGTPDLDVLATVDGRPAVAMRRLGEGRVYWIGHNLVWHAFLTQNTDERALIEAVFAEALGGADAP